MAMGCNEVPIIKDDTGSHIYNRMLIFTCEHHVPKEDIDPYIFDKMLSESSAIVSWGLEGLHRLIENQFAFTESSAMQEAVEKYRKEADPVYQFITTAGYVVTQDRHDRVLATALNEEFTSFCRNNHIIFDFTPKNIRARLEKLGILYRAKGTIGDSHGVGIYEFITHK